MSKALFSFIFVLLSLTLYSQDHTLYVYNAEPSYPGGEEALVQFLKTNQEYPSEARALDIMGVVRVMVEMDESGNITSAKSIHSPHISLATEAVRLVELMPAWNPAKRGGKNVSYQTILLINFELDK